jgi:peptide/nickel transport system permease protein
VIRFALRRLLQLPLVLLGISVVVFGLMALLPGDPALALLGPYATPERAAALRAELGLDRPLPVRYATWLARAAHGDLGTSLSLERPVADELVERGAATALLAATAFALASVLGIAGGAAAALLRGRWPDRSIGWVAVAGLSTPPFWLAMLAVLAFAVTLPWFPVSGMRASVAGGGALDVLRHLVLPAAVLSVVAASVIARVTRTAMRETAREEFVRVARARGLSERRIWLAHVLRPALVQVVPVIGLQAGYVIGGALYVETVFQWPGLGRSLVEAVAARDLVLVQGGALVMAAAYVAINLVADLVQAALDPRIRR